VQVTARTSPRNSYILARVEAGRGSFGLIAGVISESGNLSRYIAILLDLRKLKFGVRQPNYRTCVVNFADPVALFPLRKTAAIDWILNPQRWMG
jgi:hypothetical protein